MRRVRRLVALLRAQYGRPALGEIEVFIGRHVWEASIDLHLDLERQMFGDLDQPTRLVGLQALLGV